MTIPRSQQICLETSRHYHCTSRCVRRGFLCGFDEYSQTNYEHRRTWLEQRLQQVASVFCIKLSSYVIMNNHYHAVLFVDKEQALALSDFEVIDRWKNLRHLPPYIKRAYEGAALTHAEHKLVSREINEWRQRLYSIEWFMKEVNQYIAQKANKEDECTGHFWDGRYDSQQLLGVKGQLSAMVYDDLNPVRAGMDDKPEDSKHTSLAERLRALRKGERDLQCLHPFIDGVDDLEEEHIPLSFTDYLQLVDWTGRQIRQGKTGVIDSNMPPILERLNLTQSDWLQVVTGLKRPRATRVGAKSCIKAASIRAGRTRASGYSLPD